MDMDEDTLYRFLRENIFGSERFQHGVLGQGAECKAAGEGERRSGSTVIGCHDFTLAHAAGSSGGSWQQLAAAAAAAAAAEERQKQSDSYSATMALTAAAASSSSHHTAQNLTPLHSAQTTTTATQGAFPLDRMHQCDETKTAFLSCMRRESQNHSACRDFSLAYLTCRQQVGLMDETPLSTLGFNEEANAKARLAAQNDRDGIKNKEDQRVAGMHIKERPKPPPPGRRGGGH